MTVQVLRAPGEFGGQRLGSWGLVPTMGALHAGHLTLISRAAAENETTVVSIFVNPTQFGSANDLSRYPRDLETDIARAASAGAEIIYAPEPSTVYPPGFSTWVEPGSLADRWEGESRPGHFRGVATVVTILLDTVKPDRSYFGQKDFQQLQIIRRMHSDLRLPGEVIASPTVRDMDGLALSSRNARLSTGARLSARKIPKALEAMVTAAAVGVRQSAELEEIGRQTLSCPDVRIDYLAVVDDATLEPVTFSSDNSRVLLAVEVDGVRLIDNVALPSAIGHISGTSSA